MRLVKRPCWQTTHEDWPDTGWARPAVQSRHAVGPIGLEELDALNLPAQ
jgi:hypothetical protein